jgi:hypothetical protein
MPKVGVPIPPPLLYMSSMFSGLGKIQSVDRGSGRGEAIVVDEELMCELRNCGASRCDQDREKEERDGDGEALRLLLSLRTGLRVRAAGLVRAAGADAGRKARVCERVREKLSGSQPTAPAPTPTGSTSCNSRTLESLDTSGKGTAANPTSSFT